MKLTVSKGNTNFTLEFEEKDLAQVSKNIGEIMLNALTEGSQKEIEFEEVPGTIKEVQESLQKLKEEEDPAHTEMVKAETLRLKREAEKQAAEQEAKRKEEAENKAKLEAERKEKYEKEIAEARELKSNAETLQSRADAETDNDIKSLLQNKADSAKVNADEMMALIAEEYPEFREEETKIEKKEPTKVEPQTKTETKKEDTQKVEIPPVTPKMPNKEQEKAPTSEAMSVIEKGSEIIERQVAGKITAQQMTRELMNLSKGSKAERLYWAAKTFTQKEQFWKLMVNSKGIIKSLGGLSNKDIQEFKDLINANTPF